MPECAVPDRVRPLLTALLLCCASLGALGQAETRYTVQPGDHPWGIAQRYLQSTTLALPLARHNGIRNDRRIAPGTVLRIPSGWLRMQEARTRLATLHGDVQIVLPSGASRPAVQGEVWEAGTVLRTGVQSTARLEFEDGSQALVRQLSHVRLLQSQRPVLGDDHLLRIDLVRGAIENLVRPVVGPSGRFEIRSPAAVAAVRGTRFRVQASDTRTHTEVLEGEVLVRNDAGQAAASAGTGSVTALGASPTAPTALPQAPDLSTLPARFERLPVDWPIPPVSGGAAYRTQVAPSGQFELLYSDEASAAPRVRILAAPDGLHVVRVRTVDAQGLEGPSAEQRIEIFAQPAPPILIEPRPGSQTLMPRPEFRWAQVDAAAHYRLQVFAASAPDTQPLDDQVLAAGPQATARLDLPAGEYRWRVATIDPTRQRQGPWSDFQRMRRVEPGPGLPPPVAQDGTLVLQWPAQAHAARYDLQIAGDRLFDRLLSESSGASPGHVLRQPAPGTYHVRVRVVGTDGFTGPWGEPQSFTVPEPPPPPAPPPTDWRGLLMLLPLLLLAL